MGLWYNNINWTSNVYPIFGGGGQYKLQVHIYAVDQGNNRYKVRIDGRHYCQWGFNFKMTAQGTCNYSSNKQTISGQINGSGSDTYTGWTPWNRIWDSNDYLITQSPTINLKFYNRNITYLTAGNNFKLEVNIPTQVLTTKYSGKPSAPSSAPTISSPIYYRENYTMNAPTSHTQYRYRDINGNWGGWTDHNSNTYNGNSWDKSAVQWRVRNINQNYQTWESDWKESSIVQYTLRPPTVSLKESPYYNNTYNENGIVVNPSLLPSGAYQDWQYSYSDDNVNWSDWSKGEDSFDKIRHPYIKIRVCIKRTNFNSSEFSTSEGRQVKLNKPSKELQFTINPVTVSSSNTIEGTSVTQNGETFTVDYINSLAEDRANDLIPSNTSLMIINTSDAEWKDSSQASFNSLARYNGVSAQSKYSYPGYIDSDIVSMSERLVVNTIPTITDSNYSKSFIYEGNELTTSTIVNPDSDITVRYSSWASTKNLGRFNWVKVYAVDKNGAETELISTYTDAWMGKNSLCSIDVLLTTLVAGEQYYLRIAPCYCTDDGTITEGSCVVSLKSPTFLYGGVPEDIDMIYPNVFGNTNQIYTLNNKCPICFKLPNPGAGNTHFKKVYVSYMIEPNSLVVGNHIHKVMSLNPNDSQYEMPFSLDIDILSRSPNSDGVTYDLVAKVVIRNIDALSKQAYNYASCKTPELHWTTQISLQIDDQVYSSVAGTGITAKLQMNPAYSNGFKYCIKPEDMYLQDSFIIHYLKYSSRLLLTWGIDYWTTGNPKFAVHKKPTDRAPQVYRPFNNDGHTAMRDTYYIQGSPGVLYSYEISDTEVSKGVSGILNVYDNESKSYIKKTNPTSEDLVEGSYLTLKHTGFDGSNGFNSRFTITCTNEMDKEVTLSDNIIVYSKYPPAEYNKYGYDSFSYYIKDAILNRDKFYNSYMRNFILWFLRYYQNILQVDPDTFAKQYPILKESSVVVASTPKEWFGYIAKLYSLVNEEGTGGFPFLYVPDVSETLDNMIPDSIITTVYDDARVPLNYKKLPSELSKYQGMYYDVILKHLIDNI